VIRDIGAVFQKRSLLLENSSDDACETRQDHYTAHLTANYKSNLGAKTDTGLWGRHLAAFDRPGWL
jgi:hypothetical protein